jgi:hypothetical protein
VTKSSSHKLSLHWLSANSSSTTNFPWLSPTDDWTPFSLSLYFLYSLYSSVLLQLLQVASELDSLLQTRHRKHMLSTVVWRHRVRENVPSARCMTTENAAPLWSRMRVYWPVTYQWVDTSYYIYSRPHENFCVVQFELVRNKAEKYPNCMPATCVWSPHRMDGLNQGELLHLCIPMPVASREHPSKLCYSSVENPRKTTRIFRYFSGHSCSPNNWFTWINITSVRFLLFIFFCIKIISGCRPCIHLSNTSSEMLYSYRGGKNMKHLLIKVNFVHIT